MVGIHHCLCAHIQWRPQNKGPLKLEAPVLLPQLILIFNSPAAAEDDQSPSRPHTPDGPYFTSATTRLGPHKWPKCPRRSPEPIRRARSAPSTPKSQPRSPPVTSSRRQLPKGVSTVPNGVKIFSLYGVFHGTCSIQCV